MWKSITLSLLWHEDDILMKIMPQQKLWGRRMAAPSPIRRLCLWYNQT